MPRSPTLGSASPIAWPPGSSKAILLDSDVLVLHDLEQLWSTPFENGIACAAQDPSILPVSAREGLETVESWD